MSSSELNPTNAIHTVVREQYGRVAEGKRGCCGGGCASDAQAISSQLGYSDATLAAVPEAANLGLGCGNPTALAALSAGEVVLDLGAGAGLDALIAARAVGPEGRVIGVDMTPGMLASARENAVKMGVHGHVEFREGLIEALPVTSDSVDVVISNCVINLSPDKGQAFREAFRVLKPGGRLAVSDIVLDAPLPEAIAAQADLYVACISGASTEADYLAAIRAAGFVDVTFSRTPATGLCSEASGDPLVRSAIDGMGPEQVKVVADVVYSYKIAARKP